MKWQGILSSLLKFLLKFSTFFSVCKVRLYPSGKSVPLLSRTWNHARMVLEGEWYGRSWWSPSEEWKLHEIPPMFSYLYGTHSSEGKGNRRKRTSDPCHLFLLSCEFHIDNWMSLHQLTNTHWKYQPHVGLHQVNWDDLSILIAVVRCRVVKQSRVTIMFGECSQTDNKTNINPSLHVSICGVIAQCYAFLSVYCVWKSTGTVWLFSFASNNPVVNILFDGQHGHNNTRD